MEESLPLGRRIIKLTVASTEPVDGARRGQRRVGWVEWAVEPLRATMGRRAFEDLVSALCTVIGWESFIVLADVRGLDAAAAERIAKRSALAILDAAVGDAHAR